MNFSAHKTADLKAGFLTQFSGFGHRICRKRLDGLYFSRNFDIIGHRAYTDLVKLIVKGNPSFMDISLVAEVGLFKNTQLFDILFSW